MRSEAFWFHVSCSRTYGVGIVFAPGATEVTGGFVRSVVRLPDGGVAADALLFGFGAGVRARWLAFFTATTRSFGSMSLPVNVPREYAECTSVTSSVPTFSP